MSEWNWEKNNELGLSPKTLTLGSHQKVWWKCIKGHEWQAIIKSRNNGNGCPYCSGRFAIKKVCDNFNKNDGVVSYELSDDKLEKVYEIAYNLFTLVSHNKLKAAPNTDLSDYFKANTAKSDFCTEFKKISTLSNIEEAKTKSSELLQNGLQQPIIGE